MTRGVQHGFKTAYPGGGAEVAPFFKGVLTAATAITANANMLFIVVEDTSGGYDVSTFAYTAHRAGVYMVTCGLQFSGSPPGGGAALNFFRNGVQRFNGRVAAGTNFGGPQETWLVRLALGDTLTAQATAAFTTAAAPAGTENSVWTIQWLRP